MGKPAMSWNQAQGAKKDGTPMHHFAMAWEGLQEGTMVLAQQNVLALSRDASDESKGRALPETLMGPSSSSLCVGRATSLNAFNGVAGAHKHKSQVIAMCVH